MADKTKYYYLKIKENFFDSEDMKLLESMDNGYLYSNILMKMYLLSLKNGGKLMYKDKIPYNSKMLSTILNHNVDVLDRAIQIFKELGLIEILETGAIFMLDIQNYIGKSSDEADRIRAYRSKIEYEKSDLLQMYENCTTNFANIKDRDRDKDITINKKEIDNNKLLSTKKSFQKPTVEQIQEYCNERRNGIDAQQFYDFYESKGWKVGKNSMKDWKAAIRTWENNKKERSKNALERFDEELSKL